MKSFVILMLPIIIYIVDVRMKVRVNKSIYHYLSYLDYHLSCNTPSHIIVHKFHHQTVYFSFDKFLLFIAIIFLILFTVYFLAFLSVYRFYHFCMILFFYLWTLWKIHFLLTIMYKSSFVFVFLFQFQHLNHYLWPKNSL